MTIFVGRAFPRTCDAAPSLVVVRTGARADMRSLENQRHFAGILGSCLGAFSPRPRRMRSSCEQWERRAHLPRPRGTRHRSMTAGEHRDACGRRGNERSADLLQLPAARRRHEHAPWQGTNQGSSQHVRVCWPGTKRTVPSEASFRSRQPSPHATLKRPSGPPTSVTSQNQRQSNARSPVVSSSALRRCAAGAADCGARIKVRRSRPCLLPPLHHVSVAKGRLHRERDPRPPRHCASRRRTGSTTFVRHTTLQQNTRW
jgi:hypothetical protein